METIAPWAGGKNIPFASEKPQHRLHQHFLFHCVPLQFHGSETAFPWYFLILTLGSHWQDDNYFYLLSGQRPALGLSPSRTREELDWIELNLSLVDTSAQVKVNMWAFFSLHLASDGCLGLSHALVIITKRRVIWDIHMQCILRLLFNENAL